jgi:hypothetical protein
MGEKDVLGVGGDPLSKIGLSPGWQALIRRLWEADGKSVVGFLPEIVALIKATKSAAMAEHGLLMTLHSSKVRQEILKIKGFANVRPGPQALKVYCDAAGLPVGKVRAEAIALINAISKEVALSETQIMALLGAVLETKAGERKPDESVERGTGPYWRMVVQFMDAVAKSLGMELEMLCVDIALLALLETRFSALLEVPPEDGADEASAQRVKRARRKLGISRKRGRPKENGQE